MAEDLNTIFADAKNKAENASNIAYEWANGDVNTVITTDSGDLPSLAKFQFDNVGAGSFSEFEVDLSLGNVTITAQELQDNTYFYAIGNTVPRQVNIPATPRVFYFNNRGSSPVTLIRDIKTFIVPEKETLIIYTDGTTQGMYNITNQVVKKVAFASAPSSNNDETEGYSVDSIWIDTTSADHEVYICTDATTSAAQWVLISNQASDNVNITGGTISGITDLAIADGGTGASSSLEAFNNIKQPSTESFSGVAPIATTPKATAATDDEAYMTPAKTFDQFDSLPRKNYVVNGGFHFAGRGTSFTGLTTGDSGIYTLDNWKFTTGTDDSTNISQEEFALGSGVTGDPQYYLRFATTAGSTGSVPNSLFHSIKGVRTGAGDTVTLSFYAKANTAHTTGIIQLVQDFGTGGSPSTATGQTAFSSVDLTTSWQRFESTLTLNGLGGKTIGTNGDDSLQIRFRLSLNETVTIDVAQVQLEKGEIATKFEDRPPTLERLLNGEPNSYNDTTGQYEGYTALKSGRNNFIINGGFEIAQRGTVFSGINTAQYTLDRAYIATLGGGTATISKNTSDLPTFIDEEVKAVYRHNRTAASAAGSTVYEQRIENVRTLAGKTCTVSFIAKVASGTKSLRVDFVQSFGTGGSPSSNVNLVQQTVDLTSVYQQFSFTFSIPSVSGKTIGTNGDDNLRFRLLETSGFSTFDFYMANLQVEEGSVATKFEQRPIGEELALCQRYYQVVTGFQLNGFIVTSSAIRVTGSYVTEMRSIPSLTLLDTSIISNSPTAGSNTSSGSSILNSNPAVNGLRVTFDGFTGLTASEPVDLDQSDLLGLDAEL